MFSAIALTSVQVFTAVSACSSIVALHLLLSCPSLHCPWWGLQLRACFSVAQDRFLCVCPIHSHFCIVIFTASLVIKIIFWMDRKMCKFIILYSIVWLMVEVYLLLSKDRIVPPDPITTSERRTTLLRLNQVIQHRLVTGNLLPQMRNLKVIIRPYNIKLW
jgi:hypothetical protein